MRSVFDKKNIALSTFFVLVFLVLFFAATDYPTRAASFNYEFTCSTLNGQQGHIQLLERKDLVEDHGIIHEVVCSNAGFVLTPEQTGSDLPVYGITVLCENSEPFKYSNPETQVPFLSCKDGKRPLFVAFGAHSSIEFTETRNIPPGCPGGPAGPKDPETQCGPGVAQSSSSDSPSDDDSSEDESGIPGSGTRDSGGTPGSTITPDEFQDPLDPATGQPVELGPINCNVDWPTIPLPGGGFSLNDVCDGSVTPSIGQLIVFIYGAALWISGLAAFVTLVYAGFLYIFSGANPTLQGKAKTYITNVAWGIGILLLSFITLQLINPDITELEFNTPLTVRVCQNPADEDAGCIQQQLAPGGLDIDTSGTINTGAPGTVSPPTGGKQSLSFPPNLGSANNKGYYKFPEPTAGEYVFNGGTPPAERCGQLELVGIIYTVILRWNQEFPGGPRIKVGDLNGLINNVREHKTHRYGTTVDIGTEDRSVAHMVSPYDREKTIRLAQLWFETGRVSSILFADTQVISAVNQHISENGLTGEMRFEGDHTDHFHVQSTAEKGPNSVLCGD